MAWPCRLSVSQYAALGNAALRLAPRPECLRCSRPMSFDGSYPRDVREAGRVYRVMVRRARCGRCGAGEALLPDFVVRRRRDSTASVGAAVLPAAGVELPELASRLYTGVPERTVRSWRHRFAERAGELWGRLEAITVTWGGQLPVSTPAAASPAGGAVTAMGLAWRAARRRPDADVPAAWPLANVIFGNGLLETRVDLPWPITYSMIGRFRPP